MNFKEFFEAMLYQPNYRKKAYQQSIARGKENELDITKGLESDCGWTLMAASADLDKFQATDTFLVKNGQKIPVQLKTRNANSQSDIGYEVAKDYDEANPNDPPPAKNLLNNLNGRDMRGNAKLTVNLDNTGGTFRIIDTNEGHTYIQEAVRNWLLYLEKVGSIQRLNMKWVDPNSVQLIMKFDTRDHYWKIVAYIPPKKFKSLKLCKLKNKINTKFDY